MRVRQQKGETVPRQRKAEMPRGITSYRSIPIESLRATTFTSRGDVRIGDESLTELSNSIAVSGIIEPLIVRPADAGFFEVMAGGRRLAAAKLLGFRTVPCMVKACTNGEALMISLAENLQRNDLTPMEKAHGLKKLLQECQLTQDELGRQIGMSQSAIAHYLRLLELPGKVQSLLHEGALSMGHAKILAGIRDESQVTELAIDSVSNGRSVRDLEASLARLAATDKDERCGMSRRSREEVELPNGLFLVIKGNPNKHDCGTIEIPFWSEQEKRWAIAVLAEAGSRRTKAPPNRAHGAPNLRGSDPTSAIRRHSDGFIVHRDAALMR